MQAVSGTGPCVCRQRRFFKVKDLHDLFTLGDDSTAGTETGDLFADIADEILPQSNDAHATPKNGRKSSSRSDKSRSGGKSRPVHNDDSDIDDDTDRDRDRDTEAPSSSSASSVKKKGEGETKLLRNLLEQGVGVTSAISHDSIMNGMSSTGVDPISRAEAERIAKKASMALRQSANDRLSADVSVPTWTGRSGLAGAPAVVRESNLGTSATKRQRFGAVKNPDLVQAQADNSESTKGGAKTGLSEQGFGGSATCGISGVDLPPTSSADLLRRLRARNVDAGDPEALMRMDEADEAENWALLIMHELQTFFMTRPNHTASTENVLNNFKITVPAHRCLNLLSSHTSLVRNTWLFIVSSQQRVRSMSSS
jgi:DNA excision repair protein ERCC-6